MEIEVPIYKVFEMMIYIIIRLFPIISLSKNTDVMKEIVLCIMLATFPIATLAYKPMTDNEVRDLIISGSATAYPGDCPCPYTQGRGGGGGTLTNLCGDDSGYSRGEPVICYRNQVSNAAVRQYRIENGIDIPKSPWNIEKKSGD